jgi:hypothetical protein
LRKPWRIWPLDNAAPEPRRHVNLPTVPENLSGTQHDAARAMRPHVGGHAAGNFHERDTLFEGAHATRRDSDGRSDCRQANRDHRKRNQNFDDSEAGVAAGALKMRRAGQFQSLPLAN